MIINGTLQVREVTIIVSIDTFFTTQVNFVINSLSGLEYYSK